MKIISGHQPVYLPWLGLIHKASLADVFIFMDDVQYLTQDWNNRNKIKTTQGQTSWLTVPVDLKKSPSKNLKDIFIKQENVPDKKKWSARHWATLQSNYGKAPYFKEYKQFFEWLYFEMKWEKLSELNLAILEQAFKWFKIEAELLIASEQNFKGVKSDLVLEHGIRYSADVVVTGTLGKNYIKVENFHEKNINVVFQDYKHPVYEQRFGEFVSHLSFVDLLFHHGPHSREICLQGNITRNDICAQISK